MVPFETVVEISRQNWYHFKNGPNCPTKTVTTISERGPKSSNERDQKFPMKKGTIVAIKCSDRYKQQLIVMQHCLGTLTV